MGSDRSKAKRKAKNLWDWIEAYMETECNYLPEYLSDAERSNIINAIVNTLTESQK